MRLEGVRGLERVIGIRGMGGYGCQWAYMRSEGVLGLERPAGIRGMGGYRVLMNLDEIGMSYRIRKNYWDKRDGRLLDVSWPR